MRPGRAACLSFVLAVVGSLALPALPAHAAPTGALLLLQVPDGAEARVRAALGARVLDLATTKKIQADAASVGLGCASLTDACAAGFGQVAGVDEVVVVTVRPRGGGQLVRAARVDARTGRVVDVTVGRLTEHAGDGGVDVGVVAGNLYARTKTVAPVPVDVVVDPAGTRVHIDGQPATLHDGVAWLLPGAHSLAVEGAAAAVTKIIVTDRGEPDRVELAVIAPPTPAPVAEAPAVTVVAASDPTWPAVVTWTGVGLVVVGGALALGAEVWIDKELRGDGLRADERGSAELAGQAGLCLLVGGVVVGGVGAGLWWSTP